MLPTLQDTLLQATIYGSFELFISNKSVIYFQQTTLEFLALLCHVDTKQIILVVTEDANVQQLIIFRFITTFEFNFYKNFFENTETINLDDLDIQYLYLH